MNVRANFLIAVAVGVSCVVASGVCAQQAETVRSYRFVPKYSELVLGWRDREAPDLLIPIAGTFDFVTFDIGAPDPWIGLGARFERVEAGGPHPIQDVMVDLDAALNLSGLKGRQLPVAGPFDMYEFVGANSVGHDVRLFATLIGPWLSLNGETTPTAASSDSRYYAIRAMARQRPFADFNDDGIVSGDDLAAWSANFGLAAMPVDATPLGDADGDVDVDGADMLAWQRALGEQAPYGVSTVSDGTTAVAEPTSSALALAAIAALRGVRARRVRGPR